MTTDEKPTASLERAKLRRLRASIEQGRCSGISDRNAAEIRADAKISLRRSKRASSAD